MSHSFNWVGIMKRERGVLALGLMLLGMHTAMASTIWYNLSNISGNTWQYDYVISNDSSSINIDEFTVYFAYGQYANLSVVSAPTNWDPLVVQPGNFLNNDGYYDALALGNGIMPGNSLGGFSVQFDYLGSGTPGAQSFDIVDPNTFAPVESVVTSPVPLPASIWLFGSGLVGLLRWRRQSC